MEVEGAPREAVGGAEVEEAGRRLGSGSLDLHTFREESACHLRHRLIGDERVLRVGRLAEALQGGSAAGWTVKSAGTRLTSRCVAKVDAIRTSPHLAFDSYRTLATQH